MTDVSTESHPQEAALEDDVPRQKGASGGLVMEGQAKIDDGLAAE
jgi:hypothetical protein